jgi:RNA polymerase sigma factor for flagellar operon FliA
MNNRPDLLLIAGRSAPSGPRVKPPDSAWRLRLVTARDSRPDARPGERETSPYEEAFLSNLGLIDDIVRFVCHRHKLSGAEADDFGSDVRVKLVDRDYEVFRRFQQRSSLRTYLTIVIQRLYLDYRNRSWGKWRPSTEAVRLGPLAIRLERLTVRDGLRFDEACQVLRTNEGVIATDAELAEIAIRLPTRYRRFNVSDEVLTGVPAEGAFDDRIMSRERQEATRRVLTALRQAVRLLGDQDRLILRLKFQDGLGVADIARALHLEQRPLYRRLDALLQQLRTALDEAGVNRVEASAILNRDDVDISLALSSPDPAPVLGSINAPSRT